MEKLTLTKNNLAAALARLAQTLKHYEDLKTGVHKTATTLMDNDEFEKTLDLF